jgi:undecaprenyl-diphosphatase
VIVWMADIRTKIMTLLRIDIKVLIAVLAIFTGTIGFTLIAGLVTRGTADNVDIRILRFFRHPDNLIRPIGPGWLFDVMRDITALGGPTVIFLITLLVIGYFILQKEYSEVILVLAAVTGGAIMDLQLKELFGRIRPEIVPNLVPVLSFSFPSGHSMMSAIVYLSLASLIARIQKRLRDKIYIILIAIFLSFIIGVSRVYLGVHYATDVLGGWSLGLAWAAFCWLIAWYISQRNPEESI